GLGDSLSKLFRCPTHPDRRCGTRPCGAQTVLACFRSGHAGQDAPKVSKGYPPALPSNISCTPKSSFSMCSCMSKAVTGYVLPEPSAARGEDKRLQSTALRAGRTTSGHAGWLDPLAGPQPSLQGCIHGVFRKHMPCDGLR